MGAKRTSKRGERVEPDLADIDESGLPLRPLFDTGVATRAWSDGPKKEKADEAEKRRLSQQLWEALLEKNRSILIAAPSLAEMLRDRPPHQPPRVGTIEVVPFDDDAARVLGEKLPHGQTGELARKHGRSHACLKYDAMIVACAIRHQASCIVSLDENTLKKLAKRAGMMYKSPRDFLVPLLRGSEEEE